MLSAESLRVTDGLVREWHVDRAVEMLPAGRIELPPEFDCLIGGKVTRMLSVVKDEPDLEARVTDRQVDAISLAICLARSRYG